VRKIRPPADPSLGPRDYSDTTKPIYFKSFSLKGPSGVAATKKSSREGPTFQYYYRFNVKPPVGIRSYTLDPISTCLLSASISDGPRVHWEIETDLELGLRSITFTLGTGSWLGGSSRASRMVIGQMVSLSAATRSGGRFPG